MGVKNPFECQQKSHVWERSSLPIHSLQDVNGRLPENSLRTPDMPIEKVAPQSEEIANFGRNFFEEQTINLSVINLI